MKKYTQIEIDRIPNILKCHWYKEWVEEQKKPQEYLGKLAILIQGKSYKELYWITEEIDFIITE